MGDPYYLTTLECGHELFGDRPCPYCLIKELQDEVRTLKRRAELKIQNCDTQMVADLGFPVTAERFATTYERNCQLEQEIKSYTEWQPVKNMPNECFVVVELHAAVLLQHPCAILRVMEDTLPLHSDYYFARLPAFDRR